MAVEQVWLASLHLDGATAEWYYSLEREYDMLPWTCFAEFVNLRFGPPIRFNPLGELKALQKTGTVEEYERQFEHRAIQSTLSLRWPFIGSLDELVHSWTG
jgi:hypothetical protein